MTVTSDYHDKTVLHHDVAAIQSMIDTLIAQRRLLANTSARELTYKVANRMGDTLTELARLRDALEKEARP